MAGKVFPPSVAAAGTHVPDPVEVNESKRYSQKQKSLVCHDISESSREVPSSSENNPKS